MRWKSIVGATAAWAMASSAFGQALETGPCDRMNQLLTSKPANVLFKDKYDGVYRFRNSGTCGTVALRTLVLTYASGAGNSFVYNVTGADYLIEPASESCAKAALSAADLTGTFTVTQRVISRTDGYCDLIIDGAWNMRQSTGNWSWATTHRIIVYDDLHFAIGRPGEGGIFTAR